MAYQLTNSKLNALAQTAMRQPDIQKAINDKIVTPDELINYVQSHANEFAENATDEIDAASALEARYTEMERLRLKVESEALGQEWERPVKLSPFIRLLHWLWILLLVSPVVPIGLALLTVRNYGLEAILESLKLPVSIVSVLVFCAGYYAGVVYLKPLLAELRQKYVAAQMAERMEQVRADQEKLCPADIMADVRQRLSQATVTANEAVLEDGILPGLRAYINSQLEASYDLTLPEFHHESPEADLEETKASNITALASSSDNDDVTLPSVMADGLSQVFNPAHEVPTKAKEKAMRLLKAMPGGSIGVAGPRGSGKTTLLWSLCNSQIDPRDGRSTLAVMTSAPVKYDAREFILHIFSSLCYKILKSNGRIEQTPSATASTQEMHQPIVWHEAIDIALPIVRFATKIAYFLTVAYLCAGLLLFTILFSQGPIKKAGDQQRESNETTAKTATEVSPGSSSAAVPSESNIIIGKILTLAQVLELKPAMLITRGMTWLVLYFICSCFLREVGMRRHQRERFREWEKDSTRESSQQSWSTLEREAFRWWQEIKFQQSYSSGWSGALKLPIGVEGSLNKAISLSNRQLTLPEITHGYREFVELAEQQHQVIVAIDELDKIESAAEAQQFLNDIKVIFGLKRCFYLVSVSENAMSNFERRGLPFRDAFDSAFDAMIYVDYLDAEAAAMLLERRVIGLPVPFVKLCYCFSGGLARDLLRSCRDLIDLASSATTRDLDVLISSMIESDLRAKIRATIATATSAAAGRELDLLLKRLKGLQNRLDGGFGWDEALLHYCSEIMSRAETRENIEQQDTALVEKAKEQENQSQYLHLLASDFVTYLYWTSTLMDIFCLYSKSEDWKDIQDTTIFEELAQARRLMSSNSALARSIITDIRKARNLEFIEIPDL